MENAAQTEQTETAKPAPSVHVVSTDADGKACLQSFVNRTMATKYLNGNPSVQVLGIFKGKKLSISEKKQFQLS